MILFARSCRILAIVHLKILWAKKTTAKSSLPSPIALRSMWRKTILSKRCTPRPRNCSSQFCAKCLSKNRSRPLVCSTSSTLASSMRNKLKTRNSTLRSTRFWRTSTNSKRRKCSPRTTTTNRLCMMSPVRSPIVTPSALNKRRKLNGSSSLCPNFAIISRISANKSSSTRRILTIAKRVFTQARPRKRTAKRVLLAKNLVLTSLSILNSKNKVSLSTLKSQPSQEKRRLFQLCLSLLETSKLLPSLLVSLLKLWNSSWMTFLRDIIII
mmetsp:Transcript_11202/g.16799  ORF Transcript_11202/g.16799 Transcript_11202/m.16799 type:complete len:269 (-) Transcript_11202:107-913(-)